MRFNLILGFILSTAIAYGQDCHVKIEALSGSYFGACKKGLAHGKGTATGIDSYTGNFRKGFPHEQGVYTWANGDIYTGAWKMGRKNGEGKMISKGDTTRGYWIEDEYNGEERFVYKVIEKAHNIGAITFFRVSKEENKIEIRYEKETRSLRHDDIHLLVFQGSYNRNIIQNDLVKTIEEVTFPFQAEVSGEFEFVINLPGRWEILVAMVPTKDNP